MSVQEPTRISYVYRSADPSDHVDASDARDLWIAGARKHGVKPQAVCDRHVKIAGKWYELQAQTNVAAVEVNPDLVEGLEANAKTMC